MTEQDERAMHAWAASLEQLTRGTGWEAMRYQQIGMVMERLSHYCATCDCRQQLITARQETTALVTGLAEALTPDHKKP